MTIIKVKRTMLLFVLALLATMVFGTYFASAMNENDYYMIISKCSDQRVLDIQGGVNGNGKESGRNLEIYNRNNTTNQRFKIEPAAKSGSKYYYFLRPMHSGLYLRANPAKNKKGESNVTQSRTFDRFAQWRMIQAGNDYYYFENRGNGNYLDLYYCRTNLGNNVLSVPPNRCNAQKWRVVSAGNTIEKKTISNGIYEIHSANSTSSLDLVLDVQNFSQAVGGNLQVYKNYHNTCQKFIVTYLPDKKYYTIKPYHSLKWVAAEGKATATDNVVQKNGNGSNNNQYWTLEDAGRAYGNQYYYVRCKAGNYLENTGGTRLNGNVKLNYKANGSYKQKWVFVRVG